MKEHIFRKERATEKGIGLEVQEEPIQIEKIN